MQAEFSPLLETTISLCTEYFGNRLLSFYLHGSIYRGDAVLGISDLDTYLIIGDTLDNDDTQWLKVVEDKLNNQFCDLISEVHLNVHPCNEVREDKFSRFVLKYGSELVYGRDVVTELNNSGIDVLSPCVQLAKSRLAFAKSCFESALKGERPACTGEIPENTYYAARMFSRYFVVIEGAYYLMTKGMFVSFNKEDVLKGLYVKFPQYSDTLDVVNRVLIDAPKVGITHKELLNIISPLVYDMFEQIESVCG